VVPLAMALPSLARGNVRAYQWWSMLILVYLTEGLVRATSDVGPSVALAGIEAALAAAAFAAILAYVHRLRKQRAASARADAHW
ncbi:MAG: DUF2069 domain-containing protein, partial [Burkholderiaceae bacterium]